MRTLLCIFLLFGTPFCWAHPVAFQGSVGLMGYQSKEMSDLEVNYSVRYWFAPALQLLRFTEDTSRPDYAVGKLNFLLRRWNGEDHQANIYVHGGGGLDLRGDQGLFHMGITADAENRRLYVLAQWESLRSWKETRVTYWKARGGISPYLGDFNGLNSWFILEVNGKNRINHRSKVAFVPTLRFFYKNVLWEVGTSLEGSMHLNYIIHI